MKYSPAPFSYQQTKPFDTMTGQNATCQLAKPEPQTIRELLSMLQAEAKELDDEISLLKEALATVSRGEDPSLPQPIPEERWLPFSCDAMRALHTYNMRARLALEDIRRRLLL